MARRFTHCEFCNYYYDAACGRYGCPNCLGDPALWRHSTITLPAGIEFTTPSEWVRLTTKRMAARWWLYGNLLGWAMNKRVRAYFHHKERDSCVVSPFAR